MTLCCNSLWGRGTGGWAGGGANRLVEKAAPLLWFAHLHSLSLRFLLFSGIQAETAGTYSPGSRLEAPP